MARVQHATDFTRALEATLVRLRGQGQASRIAMMRDDLGELERLLTRFPDAGRALATEGAFALRKLRLRRTPFYVWYVVDGPHDVVTFVRLFHTRQRAPDPRF